MSTSQPPDIQTTNILVEVTLNQGSTALRNPLRASALPQVGRRPIEGSHQDFGTLPLLEAHV